MDSSWQPRPVSDTAGRARGPGAIVRSTRKSQGLTLAQLGALVGYSAAQVSRYERGIAPLTDITVLRRFAAALGIGPQVFGLSPADTEAETRHAVMRPDRQRGTYGNTVDPGYQWEDGDDPVRRRELLANAATLAGATALGAVSGRGGSPGTSVSLEDVLYNRIHGEPIPLPRLRAAVLQARDDFRAARYHRLPTTLPKLIAAAQITNDAASSGDHAELSTVLADAWILAADFAVKVNDDPAAWLTADRALQAAQAANDPLTLADAQRAVATAMRRSGHPGRACELLIRACHDIAPTKSASVDSLAMYGNILNVAAYTAATGGDRDAAGEFIAEAAETAIRVGPVVSGRVPTFNIAGVTLFQVSIAQVLGDSGTAIDHAKRLRPAEISTPERQGRFWVDVARAYHQWGKPERCYAALLAAERAAPAEVRYRPPVHRMTESLLRSGSQHALPGLRAFASRIGFPGA